MATMMLFSFGFRHGKPTQFEADHIIDIRPWFGRNPYHDKKLRKLRGTDKAVQDDILKTPDFERKYTDLKNYVANLSGIVAIGCTGGHHRSVYLVERMGKDLECEFFHRDYDKP